MNKSIKVALDSLGCKLNQAETELFARQLAEAGYELVPSVEKADVYVLNTCTVTHIADRKSRHLLRLAHRQNPGARLVAIGCYAERSPQELAQIDGVDLVLGNEEKSRLLRRLQESGFLNPPLSIQTGCHYNSCRTRACIKVQDGCHSLCTYCIVPLVRRREESVTVDRIIAEIRQRVIEGAQEVVLTGTEIGSYHDNKVNLGGLLKSILAETDVTRLRLSSLQPQEISLELLGLWRDSRLCPHFHLSLQSGSDTVLGRMKRRYTTADYQRAVSLIREAVPEAAITTDVIVGFPGETEAEFQQSYNFYRQMAFARIHVFPYSPRQETEAARMPHQVADKVKRQRSQKMLALAEESAHNFHQRFLGKTMPVLWEKQSDGIWSGLTANYIKVYTESSEDLTNKLVPVKLVEIRGDVVWGK
ncbi:MAG TPA: tRNA (N(6)-L-threonylcarbamoyladenosine(37)-C(2))-methylthiotransferase MtaB [Dehalococcoidales bacterium]|nr:tRNA (N(6)-L-threonylcarbamoyladenosine(37)-C(2))-methylthiotransferase MtaB [Dehalococcoidales bacterium]